MKALLLLGPTASGKTAATLALAERFPIEVVSVDSAQVYRGMDVGTAKPDAAERARVPHHLLDIIDPTQSYSAGRFREDALRLVAEIQGRGRLPVLAGGTMMYFRVLTEGIAELPRSDPVLRAQIEAEADRVGWPEMHRRLAQVDAESAARLEPTDAQRIERALEVHRMTGTPLSQLQRAQGTSTLPFESLRIGLEPSERSVLHDRIATRFRAMLRAGLVDELQGLRRRYALDARLPSMRSVGYRQAWQTLEGEAPPETLEARGIAATRQLAKRQLTWLRSMPRLERYDCLRSDLGQAISARVDEFLSRPPRGT